VTAAASESESGRPAGLMGASVANAANKVLDQVLDAPGTRIEMPYFNPPDCLYCPNHPPMSRKLFYNRGDDEALYGLVPITAERTIIDGVPPTPVRVFQCMFCGSLALFSQDHEHDWELTAKATAAQAEKMVIEQQVLDDATPGNP
jgi:hypothetical protein